MVVERPKLVNKCHLVSLWGECTRHHNTQMSTPLGGMWDEKAKQRKNPWKMLLQMGPLKVSFFLCLIWASRALFQTHHHTHILHTASWVIGKASLHMYLILCFTTLYCLCSCILCRYVFNHLSRTRNVRKWPKIITV